VRRQRLLQSERPKLMLRLLRTRKARHSESQRNRPRRHEDLLRRAMRRAVRRMKLRVVSDFDELSRNPT
tara:strand:+ start:198 stop:404 length:207 start_codon:yes stop_codon:yes gene_type:complete